LRDLSANIALKLWLIIIYSLLWLFRRTVIDGSRRGVHACRKPFGFPA